MTQGSIEQAVDAAVRSCSNKKVAYQGGYAGQCVSLAKHFIESVSGRAAPATGTGWADGWLNRPGAMATLFNAPEAFVASKTYPKGSLFFAKASHHVGIYVDRQGSGARVFEQNADPDGSPAHLAIRPGSRISHVMTWKVATPPPAAAPAPSNSSWTGRTVLLSARVSSWRCYVPGTQNVKCVLNPAKFGGLSYVIQGKDALGRALIDTKQFGRVGLPIDGDATIR